MRYAHDFFWHQVPRAIAPVLGCESGSFVRIGIAAAVWGIATATAVLFFWGAPSHEFVVDVVSAHIAIGRFFRHARIVRVCCGRGLMLMSITDETVKVADQTTDERLMLHVAVELVRPAEQLVYEGLLARQLEDNGCVFQKLRVRGRGGERT